MADFCAQCSMDHWGPTIENDFRRTEDTDQPFISKVLCEGCGVTWVNHEGECISFTCPIHGTANIDKFQSMNMLVGRVKEGMTRVAFKIPLMQKNFLRDACALEGKTLSEFMREAVLTAAFKTLDKNLRMKLTVEESKRVMKALDKTDTQENN